MKKGVSQIDWIVSLALFLLYISWFFVFISPQISLNPNSDASLNFLKNDFYNEFKWSLVKTPLFLSSNYSGLLPIIVTNNFDSNDIRLNDNTPFILWNNKIIFLGNMSSNKETYWIIEGSSYSQNYNYQGIDAKQNKISVENMSINLQNSLIRKVKYKNNNRIKDTDFWINDDSVSVISNSLDDYGFVAIYTANLGNINYSTYIFDKNTEIYNKILTGSNGIYKLKITIDLDNYNSYYSDNLNFGDFSYTNGSSTLNFTHTKITLYGADSLTMFFDSNVSFNFTDYNTSLYLTMTFDVWDDYNYKFVFHEEGNDLQKEKVVTQFGVSSEIEGINLDNLITNYTYLENKWGVSDFYVLVYENSSEKITAPSFIIGEFNPGKKNVFAETENLKSLNVDGTFKQISVNYRKW